MGKITKVRQVTENPFLNFFELETLHKNGRPSRYFMASRARRPEELKLNLHEDHADAVTILMLTEDRQRIVLVRQYRYPVDGWIYELPAGLLEPGESAVETAVREAREETGLEFTPWEVDPRFMRPFYNTVGMTDECGVTVYGTGRGEPSSRFEEESEEIEVVLADKEEAKRILAEERLSSKCALHLMQFAYEAEPFAFLFAEGR